MLSKHYWNDSMKWVMAECMHKRVIKKVKELIASPKYLTLSCDELTTIDNQSWIISIPMLFKINVTYK